MLHQVLSTISLADFDLSQSQRVKASNAKPCFSKKAPLISDATLALPPVHRSMQLTQQQDPFPFAHLLNQTPAIPTPQPDTGPSRLAASPIRLADSNRVKSGTDTSARPSKPRKTVEKARDVIEILDSEDSDVELVRSS